MTNSDTCMKAVRHLFPRNILTVLILSIIGVFAAKAYEYDEDVNDILKRMYAERGHGWVCQWQLDMPDRNIGDPYVRTVVGKSGMSFVEFVPNGFSGAMTTLNIKNFVDGYTLPVTIVGLDGTPDVSEQAFVLGLEGTGLNNGKSGYIQAVDYIRRYNDTYHSFAIDANPLMHPGAFDAQYVSSVKRAGDDRFEIRIDDSQNGYIMFKDWERNNNSNNQFVNSRINGSLCYFKSLSLNFYRQETEIFGEISTVRNQYDPDNSDVKIAATYPVELKKGNGFVEVRNMYGKGLETSGDVWNYNFNNNYRLVDSSVRLNLGADGTVTYQTPEPGMLDFSPLAYIPIAPNGKLEEIEFFVGERNAYFTDYVVVSRQQFDAISFPEPGANASETESRYRAFRSQNMQTPVGTWRENVPGRIDNPHWDTPEGKRVKFTTVIELDDHCLVPIRYNYNSFAENSDYFFDYCDWKKSYGIVVTDLLLQIDARNEIDRSTKMQFDLDKYSNGTIFADDEARYVNITGKLSAAPDNVDLFIVRGPVTDLSSTMLRDTQKGHLYALYLDPEKYAAPDESASDNSRVNVVVPLKDIPANPEQTAAEKGYFTLYARYTASDRSTRFRPLIMLTDEMNSVSPVEMNREPQVPFVADGCLVSALRDIEIFDLEGRNIARIGAGESLTLPVGLYVIREPKGVSAHKLIIR